MNNLAQKQRSAKKAHLDNQTAQTIAQYEKADTGERTAIIAHINSFLTLARSKDERIFWLKFRQKLERLNEQSVF